MPPSEARLYFVVTVKGDLGPFSKQELREQLRERTFTNSDRVRNAFGRPLGSVGELLGNISQVSHAPVAQPAPASQRRQPARSGAPWPIIAVGIGIVVVVIVLWFVGNSPSAPPPEIPTPPAPAPAAPKPAATPTVQQTQPEQQPAPAARPVPTPTPAASSDGIPAGFAYLDLGGAKPAGSVASNDRGIIVLTAGGSDIWGNYDKCGFMHRPLPGSATIEVEVRQMQDTDGWDKAGIMVRQSAEPDVPHVALIITHSGLVQFITRQGRNHESEAAAQQMKSFPVWLRLQRNGSTLTGSASQDGLTWTRVGSRQIDALGGTLAAGLTVCSHNMTITNRTVFAGLKIAETR